MLLSCIFVLLLNMYDGGHLASFICPTMLLCLVYHTRVSVPMFIAVSLFFLPFVFFCCTSTPYHKCVPILILFPTFFLLRITREVEAIYSHAIPFHLFQFLPSSITMLLTMPIFFNKTAPIEIYRISS